METVFVGLMFWFLFGLVCAVVASNKKRSGCGWFILGVLLGPFGLILALVVPANKDEVEKEAVRYGGMKKCPYCAELIKNEAIKCHFCGTDLQLTTPEQSTAQEKNQNMADVQILPTKQKQMDTQTKWILFLFIVFLIGLYGYIMSFYEKEIDTITLEQIDDMKKEIIDLYDKKYTYINRSREIIVTDPKYYWLYDGTQEKPIIEFTVENNTSKRISKMYYHSIVYIANREIPWIKEDLDFEFIDGFKPGEDKYFKIEPKVDTGWWNNETKNKNNLVLELSLINALDTEGTKLYYEWRDVDDIKLRNSNESLIRLRNTTD